MSTKGFRKKKRMDGKSEMVWKNTDFGKAKWSAKKKILISFLVTFTVLILIAGAGLIYAKSTLGKIGREKLPDSLEALGISKATDDKYNNANVINIALYGLDTRADDDSGRSDAIMILSIDKDHNKIKLTSIARDTYVSVEGHDKTKITHAYAYGGSELAVKTLNSNFVMNIKDFVSVNFEQLAGIIDYVGGVTVNVSADEQKVANTCIQSDNKITKTGDVLLTGEQAVGYARDRYTGSDIQRAERQREVLMALFDNVKKMNKTKYPTLINKVLSECETSLSDGEMMNMGLWAVASNPKIETLGIPNEDCHASGQMIDKVWYFVYDLKNATDIIHKFIFEDNQP